MTAVDLTVRPGDCDSLGHVNNAVYVAQIQFAMSQHLASLGLNEAWQPDGASHWLLDEMAIEYRKAAACLDALQARLWLIEGDQQRLVVSCEIIRPAAGQKGAGESIVRSRSSWRQIDKETGADRTLEPSLLESFASEGGVSPRSFRTPVDSHLFRRYLWSHKVMRTEVDPHGLAHPQAVYNWIEESIFQATTEAGWPPERWRANDIAVFQMRHDTVFHAWPSAGERISITNRLAEVRRRRGTWINDIYRLADEQLLARNYSTGVFLNLSGRPSSPPPGMMEEIQFQR